MTTPLAKTLTVADVARICHEANRTLSATMGDATHLSWEESPNWVHLSMIAGVRYRLANPKATPESQHREWCEMKRSEGWKHGETKNPAAKTHPCLVPFEQLPLEHQAKDHLFSSVVNSLAGLVAAE